MAVITYEDVNPTLIPNTTMTKLLRDGVHQVYRIYPIDGYVLHDNKNDYPEYDSVTGEETIVLGYVSGSTSCAANYDFVANPREFYTVPADSVPADQIFGGVPSNPEIA